MTLHLVLAAALALTLPAPATAGAAPKRRAAPAAEATAPATKRLPPPDSAAVVALLADVLNGACPLAGVATGGQPDSARIASLARAGFRTVLDLRTAEEPRGFNEAGAMRAAGLRYEVIPITPASLVDSTFDSFRAAMGRYRAGGVFVHCASGNRVGAAMIPWLVLDCGWDLERAVASAKAGGLKSAEMEEKARSYVARKRAGG